jgi:hypothetical protein
MNIEEIVSKYRESIQQSRNIFISEIREFLEENKLDGKVVRIKDGRIGWLNLTDNLRMQFQYMKKNGERAPFCGCCEIEDILNDFKPFDGGTE